MYVIRFKLAAPDRTLAPSEQRALLALRALDKNSNGIKRNKQDTKHDCYRNGVAGYSISREGITVHPGVTNNTSS